MSYSFAVQGKSKAEALAKIAAEFDTLMSNQPVHARDREAAEAAAGSFIAMLRDPNDNEVVSVSIYGSLVWAGVGDDAATNFTASSVGVSTAILPVVVEKESDPTPADPATTQAEAQD